MGSWKLMLTFFLLTLTLYDPEGKQCKGDIEKMVGMFADNFVSNNQVIENLDSTSASTCYKHFSLHIVIRTLNFGESQGQGML